jgi:hypothetical protein
MTDEKKPAFVTRGELYPILGSVYLLIALAFLGLIRTDDQNTLRMIGDFILFGAAVFSSFAFSILGIRERRRQARERSDRAEPGAPADRPRD